MGIHIKKLDEGHDAIWDEMVALTPESGFMQSSAWGRFKKQEGQTVVRVGIFSDDGTLLGGSSIYYILSSLGASPLDIPHGPVLDWHSPDAPLHFDSLKKYWEELAMEINSPMARIAPLITDKSMPMFSTLARAPIDLIPTPTLIVSLDGTFEDILSRMKEKGRYNIKKAAANGVQVSSSGDPSAMDDFYRIFELTSARQNFLGEPKGFFANLMLSLGACNMAKIYFARYHGVLLAAAIVIFFGRKATFLYGGSLPFLTSSMSSYAMHWRIMRDAKELGCDSYDLYGIAPDDAPLHPYAKFSQFKTRFGGDKLDYLGARDIYFYPQLAKLWVNTLKKGERYEPNRNIGNPAL